MVNLVRVSKRSLQHYLPLIPRLKRLFASKQSAKHMRWHGETRRKEGFMCHPSDGAAWKNFDESNPDFASDSRNVRLGVCSDGFNPFNSKDHSCWPVIVTPYNLPPEMCMTTPYMFLTCIIPGHPKDQIDMYLRPLIDELKTLWTHGVDTYDVSKKENFQMRAAVMWTVSDFPAYEMLSGWMTKGYLACPVCMEQSRGLHLCGAHKMSYFDCHRKFLRKKHPYRKKLTGFISGKIETASPPTIRNGIQVYGHILQHDVPNIAEYGPRLRRAPGYGETHHWTKKSIFWELPYWPDNLIRHNLDVMHIEKNVFDNVFNTVMDVKGKTKDTDKSRLDLPTLCTERYNLFLRDIGDGKVEKPKAIYCLSDKQKKMVLDWVCSLKMPDGYVSNLRKCVDTNNLKLCGTIKSHDRHVFLQRLLPTAFSMLPPAVLNPLTELSLFFRDLCSPELEVQRLEKMMENIPVILCKLEMIFPPSFFDSMEHLLVHLPYEALMCGPVHYRWMYPFERFLGDLKRMVKNRANPEGSILAAYLQLETTHFVSYYFETEVETRRMRNKRNESTGLREYGPDCISIFREAGRPMGKGVRDWLVGDNRLAAHRVVLANCDEILPIKGEFKRRMLENYPGMTDEDMEDQVILLFPNWFQSYVHHPMNNIHENHPFRRLCFEPDAKAMYYRKYEVNGFKFRVNKSRDDRVTQNSGVCVLGEDGSASYGVLENVIQILYPGPERYTVTLFDCKWYDTVRDTGIRTHPTYGIVEINTSQRYPSNERFVLAQHVSQVYYLPYPDNSKGSWHVVIKTRPRSRIDHRYDILQEEPPEEATRVDTHTYTSLVDLTTDPEEVDHPSLVLENNVEDEVEEEDDEPDVSHVDPDDVDDDDAVDDEEDDDDVYD